MTYTEFLRDIDKYVGYVVEFKSRFKSNGQEYTFQRYVWDNKEFGALKPDSLIDIESNEKDRDRNQLYINGGK